jgi:hypothetical protein
MSRGMVAKGNVVELFDNLYWLFLSIHIGTNEKRLSSRPAHFTQSA